MATKQELMESIQKLEGFAGYVVRPKLEKDGTNEAGDRRYKANIRFVRNEMISFIDIYFYVIQEGEANEKAYIWNDEPLSIEEVLKV